MEEEFERCVHCNQRVQLIPFALGPQWMHWPTPYGNYRTRELYEWCRLRFTACPPSAVPDMDAESTP